MIIYIIYKHMGNHIGILMGYTVNDQKCLKIERIIDSDFNIYIGIVATQPNNPLSAQAIRIGNDGKIKRLKKYIQSINSISYEFENDTILTLTKRNGDIIINIKESDTNKYYIKMMSDIIRTTFKPIKMSNCSDEFDEIYNFIKKD
jgi:hypothetical protein